MPQLKVRFIIKVRVSVIGTGWLWILLHVVYLKKEFIGRKVLVLLVSSIVTRSVNMFSCVVCGHIFLFLTACLIQIEFTYDIFTDSFSKFRWCVYLSHFPAILVVMTLIYNRKYTWLIRHERLMTRASDIGFVSAMKGTTYTTSGFNLPVFKRQYFLNAKKTCFIIGLHFNHGWYLCL